jgi:hypothetical protein
MSFPIKSVIKSVTTLSLPSNMAWFVCLLEVVEYALCFMIRVSHKDSFCSLFLSRRCGVIATNGIILNLFVIKVYTSGPKSPE